MEKNFFSINDLITFCKSRKCYNFTAKTPADRIKIREIGMFSVENNNEDQEMSVTLKSCHIGRNLNQSFISEDSMKNAMPTFKGKPILGAFVQDEETNEWDFNGHDAEIYVDEDGKTQIRYIEQIIGNISEIEDPYLEYDKEQDKNYVIVKGKIFKEYTKAEEIINRRQTCACSVELSVNDLSYNVKENCIELNDFIFSGVTLLGASVSPGMAGSKLIIGDYSYKGDNCQDKLIEVLDKLNVTLSNFNNKSQTKEGGELEMGNFENEVVEEVVETEAGETVVDNNEIEEAEVIEETHTEETSASEDGDENQDEAQTEEKFTKNFAVELSHDDIRCALYNLIGQFDELDNDYYYIRDVYDNYFYIEGWDSRKIYKLGYSVDGENVALDGDRQEVFELIVTESEKIAIEKMREDYALLESKYNELKVFKDNYDASVLKAQKEAVLSSAEYAEIADSDEFKMLVSEMDKYSVDEIKVKADLLFAASMKKKFSFDANKPEKKRSVGINFNAKPDAKKEAYSGLFSE